MKILMIITAALGLLLALWMSWGGYVIYTTERPPYQVLQSLSNIAEIRQYEAQAWIATDCKTDALIVLLEGNGIRTSGQPFLMRYNDPWTPPFMRRNEIAIEVE